MSRNALILLLAFVGFGVLLARDDPPVFATFGFVVTGWILALIAHEFGHAWTAWKGGDHTVVERGYLTLDPLKYADLATSLVIPLIALALGGIGFPGGAVYLRPDLMRSRLWRSAASLAGPVGTFVALSLLAWAVPVASAAPLKNALAVLAFLQATALILNLLPIPGLDGYGVIRPFLPQALTRAVTKIEPLAFILLFAAIFFVPGVSRELVQTAIELTESLGVDRSLVGQGFSAFRFWT